LERPESLCARILTTRYYPKGDLLKAKLKPGSSFTSQSVIAGLETFKRRCIWRIGDGAQVNIWEDAWIPTSPSRKLVIPHGNTLLTKAAKIIDPNTGLWDENLVREFFWEVDVNRIIEIPIAPPGMDDFIAWHHTINGFFTVRSAYHVEWDYRFGRQERRALGVGRSEISLVWKKLWKLSIPAKVKIFGWRALHGLIPCFGILANQHIITNSGCSVCLVGCEDIMHTLFTCMCAKKI
jgi:hypothetical protein